MRQLVLISFSMTLSPMPVRLRTVLKYVILSRFDAAEISLDKLADMSILL